MSEDIKNLAAAYVAAQGEIGAAIKGNANPAFKGSRYADLGAVMEAIKPVLVKHDLGFIQEITEREGGVYCETVIVHKSGETYRTGKVPMPAPKQDPHGYGSAITYVKRYSLQAAFGVPSEDDDGNKAVEGKAAEAKRFPSPVESSLNGVVIDPETNAKLTRICSSLVDLVLDESEGADNSYKIWELIESIEEDEEKLHLWHLLAKHSKVRARVKVVGEQMRKAKAMA